MKPIIRAAFRTYGTLLPNHAAGWFERALLTPRPVPKAPRPEPKSPGRTSRMPYGTGWLHVTTWGRGPTVMLVHGWGSDSTSLGAFVDPLVERGFRVVAFDFPAHGRSDGTRTNLIECTGALLQLGHANTPLHAIVTHSFGGVVAANALRHGLETVGPVAMLAPPRSIKALSIGVGDQIGLPRHVSELMFQRFAERLRIEWPQLETDRMVGGLRAPLLVVHDEEDRMVPWSHGAAVAQAAPLGRLLTTAGLGHRDVVTDAGVIDSVLSFLGVEAERRIA